MIFPKQSKKRRLELEKPVVRGSIGDLTTRLSETKHEIKSAQRLRYQVFCSEMSAKPRILSRLTRRERDAHDKNCDHLLVIDDTRGSNNGIVGTQRFAVSNAAHIDNRFYSQSEFEINALLTRHPDKRFMELGRSCILPEYRTKRTMELLWHGTWDYALQKKADVMFGCASFHTDDPEAIRNCLSFLLQNTPVEDCWRVSSRHQNAIDLNKFASDNIDPKTALRSLPTLIKGYLRLGAQFSDVAVHDPEFGTIDILVVLPVKDINPKYISYYGESADRHRSAA